MAISGNNHQELASDYTQLIRHRHTIENSEYWWIRDPMSRLMFLAFSCSLLKKSDNGLQW